MSGRTAPLAAVAAILGLFCLLGLWRCAATIGVAVPLDPNEGWNAYHAMAAMGGGPLYPHGYLINNYPPLSFYVVGLLGRVVGDEIVAGRIVSLLALAAVAAGLFLTARRMACAVVPALLAPLVFVAGLLVFSDYVAMDDPQMLAHAVAMAGFVVLLHEPRGMRTTAAAALLFVMAVFVKHNVVAMPLTAAIWLTLHNRKSAAHFVLTGILFTLAGLLLFRLVYGSSLLAHLVTARGYSLADLRTLLFAWLEGAVLPLAAVAVLTGLRWRDRYVQLCAIYVLVGTAIGVAFLGGAGVDVNVLFDADIALALGLALALDRLVEGRRAALVAAACIAPLAAAQWSNEDARTADYWLHPLRQETVTARDDIALLEGRKGPAMCEMLSFCYWAHKPAEVDMFNTGQAFETGARSDAALTAQVEARRFAVIQFDPGEPYALGGNVYDALEKSYRLHHRDDFGSFYVPR